MGTFMQKRHHRRYCQRHRHVDETGVTHHHIRIAMQSCRHHCCSRRCRAYHTYHCTLNHHTSCHIRHKHNQQTHRHETHHLNRQQFQHPCAWFQFPDAHTTETHEQHTEQQCRLHIANRTVHPLMRTIQCRDVHIYIICRHTCRHRNRQHPVLHKSKHFHVRSHFQLQR